MAKLTGDLLVTRLCERLAWNSALSNPRAAALKLLQDADDWLSGLAGHLYLVKTDTVDLLAAASTATLPAWLDFNKPYHIVAPDAQPVSVLPADKFRRNSQYTYGAWGATTPKSCMVSLNAAGTRQLVFAAVNGTGVTVTYTITGQIIRTPLTDNVGSSSQLTETYETSILLKRAELQGKRELRSIVTQDERDDFDKAVERFLDADRSTREVPKPDSDQVKRKQSEQLQEGR